jgi:CDP-diacylglycerol--glycerol-3-phosphate 3-phosphatidyltransferase
MLARRQIPNLLTVARVLAVPACLVIMLVFPAKTMWLLWIFIAASLTDFLDGYLARRWNATSNLGALLDPIADKLLVALMLIYLLIMLGAPLLLPVAVILLRELYISGLREFLAAKQVTLPVSKGGKLKTALQMLAVIFLLGQLAYNPPHALNFPCRIVHMAKGELGTSCVGQPWLLRLAEMAGMPLLHASALVALLTALHYTYAARKHLR